jgi:hypothetical protein
MMIPKHEEKITFLVKQGVSEREIFSVVLKEIKSASHARAAAHVLFWLQHAKMTLKGRCGIYKEDAELAQNLGGHAKTAGRLILDLADVTKATRSKKLTLKEALFEIGYGPKPGQRTGRVRWIFATQVSQRVLDDARKLRQEKIAKGEKKISSMLAANQTSQLPQIAPILSSQITYTNKPQEFLSTPKTKKKAHQPLPDSAQAEISRLANTWNEQCQVHNRNTLVWLPNDVEKHTGELWAIIEVCQIENLSDEALKMRLALLCNRLGEVSGYLSDSFRKYNTNGLRLSSFAMYGQQLWTELEQFIIDKQREAEKQANIWA